MFTLAHIRPFGHNVGNHAIALSIRQLVYEVFGRIVTIVEYPATSKYANSNAGLTKQTINDINRFADGVIVGGGNLYENDELDFSIDALNALQVPLFLFSISRGGIYGRKGEIIPRSDAINDAKLLGLINRADISMSRDSSTVKHIQSLGGKDVLGYCPTINIPLYKSILPPVPEPEEVGSFISVRTPGQMNLPYIMQARIQSDIEAMINKLRSLGHRRIRILANDRRDLDFGSHFKKSMGCDCLYTDDVYMYLSLLSKAEFVISYRLHASLPAIAFKKPTLNITYDERAMQLSKDLGITKSSMNMPDYGEDFAKELCNKIELIKNQSNNVQYPVELWDQIKQLQRHKLGEFKKLVEEYVKS